MNAAASFRLFISVLSDVRPFDQTASKSRCSSAGAIAATSAAIVMKTPADAARAPWGAT